MFLGYKNINLIITYKWLEMNNKQIITCNKKGFTRKNIVLQKLQININIIKKVIATINFLK